MNKKKIIIITNSLSGLYSFRRELIAALLEKEYSVLISSPEDPFKESYFRNIGCEVINTPLNSRGLNPISDLILIFRYLWILLKEKPYMVLSYTIKPNVYGGILCRILGICQIVNITGLGDAIENGGVLQKILLCMYRIAINKSFHVFFQNSSNMLFCHRNGIAVNNSSLIKGSGVNVDFHSFQKYPTDEVIKFLFIARVLKSKGIDEYLYAAKQIRKKYNNTEFQILGSCNGEYMDTIEALQREGIVRYLGETNDVRPFISCVHCTVLPSYHEGMSNVNLESQSAGRPVITSNVPGCYETIIDKETGFLVNVKDSHDLINKIEYFINLPIEQKITMGYKAREWVACNFSRQQIIDTYLHTILSYNV